jgi:hypothetical protein
MSAKFEPKFGDRVIDPNGHEAVVLDVRGQTAIVCYDGQTKDEWFFDDLKLAPPQREVQELVEAAEELLTVFYGDGTSRLKAALAPFREVEGG